MPMAPDPMVKPSQPMAETTYESNNDLRFNGTGKSMLSNFNTQDCKKLEEVVDEEAEEEDHEPIQMQV